MLDWVKPAGTVPLLTRNAIHIWRASLEWEPQRRANFFKLLSEDEQKRSARFRFQKDRDHFVAARAILRTLLGQYLYTNPQDIHFSYAKQGKPFIKNQKLEFNLSHAGDWALLGFSLDGPLGVDIELIRADMEFESVARHFFSPPEVSTLLHLNRYDRPGAFFNCWTRKESFIKALGDGLSFPLDQFEVSLLEGPPAQLKSTFWKPKEAQEWSLFSFKPAPFYVGAAAIRHKEIQLTTYEWGPPGS